MRWEGPRERERGSSNSGWTSDFTANARSGCPAIQVGPQTLHHTLAFRQLSNLRFKSNSIIFQFKFPSNSSHKLKYIFHFDMVDLWSKCPILNL
jgi:hypothetical protein